MTPNNPVVITPKTAAILVAHNQADELRLALGALEKSENRELLEILVVDCGSSDSTPALGEEFPGITLLVLPQNFGATKALNIATRTARAEFLFLLSPEVGVAPDTVARLTEQLETRADLTGVCPLLVDDAGKAVARTRRYPDREALVAVRGGGALSWVPISEETLAQERCVVMYPGREALLVRKNFVTGMNYFDERFGEYWADADMAVKIRKAGRKVEMVAGIRAIWHVPAEESSEDTISKSDRIVGAGALIGKHYGFLAGLGFRVAAMLGALGRFDFSLLSALAGGKKVGSQAQ
jgi:GT2 family glycosyltransferase